MGCDRSAVPDCRVDGAAPLSTDVRWSKRRRGGSATGAPWRDVRSVSGTGTRSIRTSTVGSEEACGRGCWRRRSRLRSSLPIWTGSHRSTPRRACSPARCDASAHHRGLCRTTRSSVTSRLIMRSAARARADTKSHTGLRREGTCPRVHPHTRTSGRHQHADRDAERDPRPGRERQATVETGPGARGQGLPVKSEPCLAARCAGSPRDPERDRQIAHRRKRRGRPIDFGHQQRVRCRGRNVVERCFNKLKQWRGIAMRSDKNRTELPLRSLPRCHTPLAPSSVH